MLQVPAFTQRSTAQQHLPLLASAFPARILFQHPPDKKTTQHLKKKKKKVPLGAFPIPPPAWAQPSANVSALQGIAERKIKQIPPRTRQAHTRRWHRAG